MRRKPVCLVLTACLLAACLFEPGLIIARAEQAEQVEPQSEHIEQTLQTEEPLSPVQEFYKKYNIVRSDGALYDDNGHALGYRGGNTAPAQFAAQDENSMALMSALPAAFDLRTAYSTSRVQPVRDQGSYGTCWAFAACGAAESNLLMDGWNSGYLSPLQLAYFTYSRSAEVAALGGGTAGDIVTYKPIWDSKGKDIVILNRGGETPDAVTAMANWLGLAAENDVPYSMAGTVAQSGLSSAYAYLKDAAHLQNAAYVNMQDRVHVKEMLMSYGAASVDYYSDDSWFYCYNNKAYYCPGNPTNHAVTLIGWNDNFPASNFATPYYELNDQHKLPSINGAWLCKNSWGTTYGDGGYFWISYDDGSLTNATFLDMTKTTDYDRVYQYDGGVFSYRGLIDAGSKSTEAAVYTAQADEYVCAVGFYAESANIDVTAQVYTNITGNTPDSGTAQDAAAGSRSLQYEGYYTVPLASPVFVAAGSRFSVCLTITDRDGDIVYHMYDDEKEYIGVTNSPVASTGQTFTRVGNNNWDDFFNHGSKGNIRLKAFTINSPSTAVGLAGDVNGDGVITLADAIMLARHVTQLQTLSGRNLINANADGMSGVNVTDVLYICKKIAGLVS